MQGVAGMAIKPERGVAQRTPRDEERTRQRDLLRFQWAEFDAMIAEALDEEYPDDHQPGGQ